MLNLDLPGLAVDPPIILAAVTCAKPHPSSGVSKRPLVCSLSTPRNKTFYHDIF